MVHVTGDVELVNMQLKPEALNALKLPVKVKAGFLGSVRLKVLPWNPTAKWVVLKFWVSESELSFWLVLAVDVFAYDFYFQLVVLIIFWIIFGCNFYPTVVWSWKASVIITVINNLIWWWVLMISTRRFDWLLSTEIISTLWLKMKFELNKLMTSRKQAKIWIRSPLDISLHSNFVLTFISCFLNLIVIWLF